MTEKTALVASVAKFLWANSKRSVAKECRNPLPSLSDVDLLSAVLRRHVSNRNLKCIIAELLARFHSLAGVLSATQRELACCTALNEQTICLILAIHAAIVRTAYAAVCAQAIVSPYIQLIDYLQALLGYQQLTHTNVIYLSVQKEILASESQGTGSVNENPVFGQEVLGRALELHATAIILVHNHPSGNPTPSIKDLRFTNEVRAAGERCAIRVVDHIIVTEGQSFSFSRSGLLY